MANPLTFVRPFRHQSIRTILLVQSAPIDLALRVVPRLRTAFPNCEVDAVIREDDHEAAAAAEFARLFVVRWEDRFDVVRRLRRRRYDAIVVPTGRTGSDYLRVLPFFLRTRAILVFNEGLDWFPLHATRMGSLAHHVSGRPSTSAFLRWLATRAVLVSLSTAVLVAGTVRLEMRAWRRRVGV